MNWDKTPAALEALAKLSMENECEASVILSLDKDLKPGWKIAIRVEVYQETDDSSPDQETHGRD